MSINVTYRVGFTGKSYWTVRTSDGKHQYIFHTDTRLTTCLVWLKEQGYSESPDE